MSSAAVSPPSANDLIGRLPDGTIARFAADLRHVAGRALGGIRIAGDMRLAVAVSGGPDSMALLALATTAFPGGVVAATFDHGLRAASVDEAAMVAAACRGLGVPHATLRPDTPLAGGNVQARARAARYAALAGWASDKGGALLTAHHADDQAETLLMRLNRASGLAGLSAIRACRFEDGVSVLRPVLDWRRAELRAVVAASGLPWIDDPSNADPRFDRARIRAALEGLPGIDPAALARSAGYLADAEAVIDQSVAVLWADRWRGPQAGFAVADQPRELRRRLARRALADARREFGITLPPLGDSANVESLLDALEEGRGAVQAGIKVEVGARGWIFRPAPPRRAH